MQQQWLLRLSEDLLEFAIEPVRLKVKHVRVNRFNGGADNLIALHERFPVLVADRLPHQRHPLFEEVGVAKRVVAEDEGAAERAGALPFTRANDASTVHAVVYRSVLGTEASALELEVDLSLGLVELNRLKNVDRLPPWLFLFFFLPFVRFGGIEEGLETLWNAFGLWLAPRHFGDR